MAIGDILNKAEIAAAEAERARRFQELQSARAKESAFGAANTQTILENIRRTTAAVQGATKTIKQEAAGTLSSKESNKALQAGRAEVSAAGAAMSPLVSEYKKIQDIISGAESAYSSATVPAPIYEGGDLSSQLAAVIAALYALCAPEIILCIFLYSLTSGDIAAPAADTSVMPA